MSHRTFRFHHASMSVHKKAPDLSAGCFVIVEAAKASS